MAIFNINESSLNEYLNENRHDVKRALKMTSDNLKKDGLNYKSVRAYIKLEPTLSGREIFHACPKKLKYQ